MTEPAVHSAMPLLSVLLPTYSYGEGVQRILQALDGPGLAGQVEILIADDSPDDSVLAVVQALAPLLSLPVAYRHNLPALGPAANWNSLLDQARGRFVWLLHHDELPLGTAFLERLLTVLQESPAADVLLLECLLVDAASGRNRQHLPMALRALIARHAPGYLLRRNAVGPASCLVVRRTCYPRFSPNLRWLVDVEAYVRLLLPGTTVRPCPALAVGSVQHRDDSITARIAGDLPRLHRAEQDWLVTERRASIAGAWLALAAGRTVSARLLRAVEAAAWIALRAGIRMPSALGIGAVPRAQVLQALRGGA